MRNHLMTHLSNQRGVVMAFTAVALTAFIALTVVGVDLARLAFTANEVQSVADIAATAGAQTLWKGGTAAQAKTDAQTTVSAQNKMDGAVATIAANDVEPGIWDFTSNSFTPTMTSPNAVRATGRKTVTNFVAAAINTSFRQTDVTKKAIAPFGGPASGCAAPAGCAANEWACYCTHGTAPCLAIAAPDCKFLGNGQLPPLVVSNSGVDSAAWTGFQSGANSNNVRGFLDQGICDPPGSGGSVSTQSVGGSQINVNNGLNGSCTAGNSGGGSSVFSLAKCLFDNNLGCKDTNNDGIPDAPGGRMFSIPVFHLADCTTNPNGTRDLVGFATVNLTNACPGDNREIDLQVISRSSSKQPPVGAACFGTDCRVVLVQ